MAASSTSRSFRNATMQDRGLASEARLDVRVPIRRALSRLGSSQHILALGDQGMVSAASFAATVMIGRWATPAELGAYALAVSVLVSLQAAQESLVTLP